MTENLNRHTIPIEQFEAEASRLRYLTARERDVSILVAEGLTNKQIGSELFISPTTVRHHLSSVFRKLEIGSRFELIVILYRHQVVVPFEIAEAPKREVIRAATTRSARTTTGPSLPSSA